MNPDETSQTNINPWHCAMNPDETRPTPAHMRLVEYAVPRPDAALLSCSEETNLPISKLAVWCVDVRSYLGQFICSEVVDDKLRRQRFVTFRAAAGRLPVICVATPLSSALQFCGDITDDLIVAIHHRPPNTIPVLLGDEDDDVRVMFVTADQLMMAKV